MTAEIVNLNKFRKARERAESEKLAHENRMKHGLSKVERDRNEAHRRQRENELDGARREAGHDGNDDEFDPGAAS
jgi:hypothetical protein